MIAKRKRKETFEVFDGHLLRKVVPRRGRPYEHRCPLASFERIAHAAEELEEDGFTLETIAEHEQHAATRARPLAHNCVASLRTMPPDSTVTRPLLRSLDR